MGGLSIKVAEYWGVFVSDPKTGTPNATLLKRGPQMRNLQNSDLEWRPQNGNLKKGTPPNEDHKWNPLKGGPPKGESSKRGPQMGTADGSPKMETSKRDSPKWYCGTKRGSPKVGPQKGTPPKKEDPKETS